MAPPSPFDDRSPTVKLSALRDTAAASLAADNQAAAARAQAENAKIRTAGDLATANEAFAHGLQTVGGKAVDVSTTPPTLYVADADGTGYAATPLPDLGSDVADTSGPPQG
jgi:hypothetical protein